MGSQKKTTSQALLDLVNPEPTCFDPEDDVNTDSAAKLVDHYDELFNEEETVSVFGKNIDLLEDQDVRYVGKRVSRKRLGVDKISDNSEDDLTESEPESDEVCDYGSESDCAASSNESGSESGNVSSCQSSAEKEKVDDNDESFKHLSSKISVSEVGKGNAVRNQLKLWDNLLECRIQLQRCLITSNKFPQYDVFEYYKRECGSDFQKLLNKSKDLIQNLLEKLIVLREKLLKSYPETKFLSSAKKNKHSSNNDMDEEIPSSSEEFSEDESEDEKLEEQSNCKRRKLDDFSHLLNNHFQEYKDYRDSTIQKWNDKTRVASGKVSSRNFTSFEQSTLKQIEQILSNRQRLIQRTRLKRSVYNILGKTQYTANEIQDPDQLTPKVEDNIKEYDPEIFDDSDFYHQILRELIEKKAADVTDPIQLGRQWVELQKLRSKMKRKVDVKATKGRRIRYVVHPKLVNFMAPIPQSTWTEEAKSELYNSLFGKIKS